MSTPTERPHGTTQGTRQKGSRPLPWHRDCEGPAVKIQQLDEVDARRAFALSCAITATIR